MQVDLLYRGEEEDALSSSITRSKKKKHREQESLSSSPVHRLALLLVNHQRDKRENCSGPQCFPASRFGPSRFGPVPSRSCPARPATKRAIISLPNPAPQWAFPGQARGQAPELPSLAPAMVSDTGRSRTLIPDFVFLKGAELHKDFIICYLMADLRYLNKSKAFSVTCGVKV